MTLPRPAIRKARIEIVPMIDTIFFLLVFFMMSTLSMVKMGGLALGMPKQAAKSVGKPSSGITLSIAPNGAYYLGKKALAPSSLPREFEREIALHPNSTVLVNVAPNQKTQMLVSTLDLLNEMMSQAHNDRPILVVTPKSTGEKVRHGSRQVP